MFKSIETTRSECPAICKNKANYNTDFIGPDVIDLFGNNSKKKYLHLQRILKKTWFLVSNFYEQDMEK